MITPIGIADVTKALADTDHPAWPVLAEHWYWCRRCERAENVAWPTIGDFADTGCVRVGPFSTEWEANRLAGSQCQVCGPEAPLGMAVEQ